MRRKFLLLFLLLLPDLGIPLPSYAVSNTLGAVATQHPLATQTAVRLFQEGGNAVDAAVGAALTLAVVEPYNSGLGGGGMALIWDAERTRAHAIDFRETAPAAATSAMYLQGGLPRDASKNGPLAIALPGEIAGLELLHRRWGRLPWAVLFRDAIRYAEEGFPIDNSLEEKISGRMDCLSRDYHTAKIFRKFLKRNLPEEFEKEETDPKVFIQTDLARTLKTLQGQGAQAFYQGEVTKEMVQDLQGKGSILTSADFQNYQAVERSVLSGRFPWGRVWGMPLPSSGGISILRGLNTFEALLKKSPGTLEENWGPWWVAIFGKIFATRNEEMGDPDFIKGMPVRRWIGKSQAKKDAKQVLENPIPENIFQTLSPEGDHTTHLSVMDEAGNAVSMTLTLNLRFGSCVTAGGTGILMNNQMDDFATKPGKPNAFGLIESENNAIAAKKRPLSSMSPTLVTQKKRAILAIGSPGGPRIISAVIQVLARIYFLQEDLNRAVQAPRIHYQIFPEKIFGEQDLSSEIKRQLTKYKSLSLTLSPPWGNVQAVEYNPNDGNFRAVSDPRGIGQGVVVEAAPLALSRQGAH